MRGLLSYLIVTACLLSSSARADDNKRNTYYYYCEEDAHDAKGFRAALILSNVFEAPDRVSGHNAGVQFNALAKRRFGDKYTFSTIDVSCHDYGTRKDATNARDNKVADSDFDKLKREYIDDFRYEYK